MPACLYPPDAARQLSAPGGVAAQQAVLAADPAFRYKFEQIWVSRVAAVLGTEVRAAYPVRNAEQQAQCAQTEAG
ncbi:hypothetical protein, partial [Deinococcus sp.]|uniref:hypothetical protein n=1 Tax=Deinococcus sp. TaxID=47478 RepID=UPI00286EA612